MRYTISFAIASLVASSAFAEVPVVVTDIPPVHSLVAQVMGDLGTPELLLGRGADEHSFQLRPSQAASLNDAGLVFWIGPELTPWLERALESVPATVRQVPLLDAAGTVTQDYPEEPGTAEAEGGHDHGHDNIDPHAWLSPINAALWVDVIATELSRVDPENAATYTANAATAIETIATADAAARATLAPVSGKPIVVFHEAFGYFAASYKLTIAGAVAEGDASAPGAARLSALQDMVAAGGAVCLFPEVQHDPALMMQIVEGSPARIGAALDPVGASYDPGPGMYAALITGMATVIATCLSDS